MKQRALGLVKDIAHSTQTTKSPQRDIPTTQDQKLVDQFQLLQAGGGKKDTLIAVRLREQRGVCALEDSRWVRQCDVPKDIPQYGVCCCAVADGLTMMGGIKDGGLNSSVCYRYFLSEKRWRKLPGMITAKSRVRAVEISPMVVMVAGELLDIRLGKWSSVKSLPEYNADASAAVADGRVFILKPFTDHSNHELVEYHPASDSCTTTQIDIPIDRLLNCEMTVVAGKLYLVGRINMEYDLTTGHVTQLPKPTASYILSHCIAVRGKNILLCGGSHMHHFCDVIEEYNTVTKQWKILNTFLPFSYLSGSSFVANISV